LEVRKLHNEELNGLYCSPNCVWVIKLREIKWVGHVVNLGEMGIQGFGWEMRGKETTWETQVYME